MRNLGIFGLFVEGGLLGEGIELVMGLWWVYLYWWNVVRRRYFVISWGYKIVVKIEIGLKLEREIFCVEFIVEIIEI